MPLSEQILTHRELANHYRAKARACHANAELLVNNSECRRAMVESAKAKAFEIEATRADERADRIADKAFAALPGNR